MWASSVCLCKNRHTREYEFCRSTNFLSLFPSYWKEKTYSFLNLSARLKKWDMKKSWYFSICSLVVVSAYNGSFAFLFYSYFFLSHIISALECTGESFNCLATRNVRQLESLNNFRSIDFIVWWICAVIKRRFFPAPLCGDGGGSLSLKIVDFLVEAAWMKSHWWWIAVLSSDNKTTMLL